MRRGDAGEVVPGCYPCEAQSPAAVVQLIAASYLRHGFYWYVTGSIPDGKDPAVIDRKLIVKYGIEVSEWERRHRKKRGVANAHYLRHQYWFILLVSEGHHALVPGKPEALPQADLPRPVGPNRSA